MAKCKKCGKRYYSSDKYCGYCGKKISFIRRKKAYTGKKRRKKR